MPSESLGRELGFISPISSALFNGFEVHSVKKLSFI